MKCTMECALQHVHALAKYLHNCSKTYIIHIALKELGIPSGSEGFLFAKRTILILCENRDLPLTNEVYASAGELPNSTFDARSVESAIRRAIKHAWDERDEDVWQYYFTTGCSGRTRCPSNKVFLFAVVDFVELWAGFCGEDVYEK